MKIYKLLNVKFDYYPYIISIIKEALRYLQSKVIDHINNGFKSTYNGDGKFSVCLSRI